MKVNYITLSILLIILLISCCVITFHIRRNNLRNQINLYDEKLLNFLDNEDIQESFDGHVVNFEIPKLTKISNVKILKANDPKNEFKIRLLMIEGENLDKIKDVFFGDIKGKIVKRLKNTVVDDKPEAESEPETNAPFTGTIPKKDQLYILPPEIVKYESIMNDKEYRNIEIKLLIEEPNYLDSKEIIKKIELSNNDLNIDNLNIKEEGVINNKDIVLSQDKLNENNDIFIFKVNIDTDIDSIQEIVKKYGKSLTAEVTIDVESFIFTSSKEEEFVIKIGGTEQNFEFNYQQQIIQKKFFVKLPSVEPNSDKLLFDDIEIKLQNNSISQYKIKEIDIKIVTDDIASLFPTGLFYRPSGLTSGKRLIGIDETEWKLFLGERVVGEEGNEGKIQSKELNEFYKKIKESIGDKSANNATEGPKTKYAVTKLKIDIDINDDSQIKVTWKIPESVNDFTYGFLLNFNSTTDKKSFEIKDEKLSFDKNSYMFSTKNLIPMNKYLLKIETIAYKPTKTITLDSSEINYTYKPLGYDDYHSHLFKNGKFDIEKIDLNQLLKSNPKLVETYYQLLEYNKNKTLNDVQDIQLEIEKIVNLSKNDVNDTKCGTIKEDETSIPNKFRDYTKQQIDLVEQKKPEILNKMATIKKKISYLDELRNKKEKEVNLKFKSLKSLNDGTILRLEDLGNDKKMVLLNNGCLAFEKNKLLGKSGNFGYIKCNIFDPQQQFKVRKIESLEDYNNLMDLNLSEKVTQEYKLGENLPFYILQPMNSNKCVFINDGELSIKNCIESKDIQFQGYFSQSHCNV